MEYQIKQGDTLSGIAQAQGTSIGDLQKANPNITDPNKIYDGQSLVIPVDTLTEKPTQVNIPPAPIDNNNYSGILANLNSLAENVKKYQTEQATQTPVTTNDIPDYLKFYLDSQPAPVNTADLYTKAQQDLGLVEKQKTVNNLTSQLSAINAEAQAEQLAMKSEGLNQAGATARNITRERDRAIRALPISAQLSAAQGDLQTTENNLNTLFSLKVKDAENQYNYKKSLIDAVYKYADDNQKALLDAKKTADTQAYNDRVNNLNAAQGWASTAITQGQGELASQIMALDPKDANYQTKLGQLAGQIKAKPATPSANLTFTSGGITIPESAITTGQQVLDSVRGTDGYVYTPKYLEMLQAWKDDKMDATDFFKKYPPRQYLNPNDDSIPKYIRDMLKASSSSVGGFNFDEN